MPVRPRKISDIKPIFTNLAVTSQYEVQFGGLPPELQSYLSLRGVDFRFTNETAGLLCNAASLPGSSFATADVNGNFTGLMEKFVHTRIYTPIDLSFYVDKEYKVVKFLEHWMEYISSASGVNPNSSQYFYKMKYPDQYKCNFTKITKFNRDYQNQLQYYFVGLFPVSMSSVSVSYDSSTTMTVNAQFNYERYIPGSILSVDQLNLISNNLDPFSARTAFNNSQQQTADNQLFNGGNNIQFGVDANSTINANLAGLNALAGGNNPVTSDPNNLTKSVGNWFNVAP